MELHKFNFMRLVVIIVIAVLSFSGCSFSWHIRITKCLERHEVINHTKLTINYNTSQGEELVVNCEVLELRDFEQEVTSCNTSYQRDVNVDVILNAIPRNAECIKINVQNIWFGYLPLEANPINISAIRRFPNLTCFILAAEFGDYYQLYPLIGKPSLFQHLKGLKILGLKIPLKDDENTSISDIVKDLSVECLDLTNIRGLSLQSIIGILRNVNRSSLQQFYLRKFQYTGRNDYLSSLNVSELIKKTGTFPNLNSLDLSSNALCRITPGITKFAPTLKWIDVSENILIDSHNFAFLSEIILCDTMEYVNYNYQGYSYHRGNNHIDETSPKPLQSNQVTYEPSRYGKSAMEARQFVFVSECVNLASVGNISNLANDSIKFCKFIKCAVPSYYGDADCDEWPLFPPPKSFFQPKCMFWIELPVGKHLKYVHFSFIHFEEAQTVGIIFNGTFCLRKNQVKSIIAAGNGHWSKAAKAGTSLMNLKGFIGVETLEKLVVGDNDVAVNQNKIPKGQFRNSAPELNYLDISGNFIVFRESFELCQDSPKIKELVLRNVNATHLPPNIISNCTRLQVLRIGNNTLKEGSLSDLNLSGTNLTFIELTNMGLANLNIPFMNKVDAHPNLTLDLSKNPLSCNCSPTAQIFTKWMILNKHRLISFDKYHCNGPSGATFVSKIRVDVFWKECNQSYVEIAIESVIGTLATVLLMLMIVFLCSRRYRVKYGWFKIKQYLEKCVKRNKDETPFLYEYDAFISYCADDRFWVHETLMKTLEDKYGFHLCIHYRDFPLGAAIDATICQSMSQSREIILVLSDYALRSGWCQFELTEALRQIDLRRKQLIVIKLGSIDKILLDSKVAHIVDKHIYLEWSDNKDSHTLFWAKLVGSLYDDPQGASCLCCCPHGARALGYEDIRDPQLDRNNEESDAVNIRVGANLSPSEQLAKNSKEKSSKAEHFLSYINDILKDEQLPDWAYGPIPGHLGDVLRGNREVLKEQLKRFAYERVSLIKECLDKVIVEEKQASEDLENRL